MHDSSKQG
jgi:ATP-binding cassette subfamily A (ABC1) protein 3